MTISVESHSATVHKNTPEYDFNFCSAIFLCLILTSWILIYFSNNHISKILLQTVVSSIQYCSFQRQCNICLKTPQTYSNDCRSKDIYFQNVSSNVNASTEEILTNPGLLTHRGNILKMSSLWYIDCLDRPRNKNVMVFWKWRKWRWRHRLDIYL